MVIPRNGLEVAMIPCSGRDRGRHRCCVAPDLVVVVLVALVGVLALLPPCSGGAGGAGGAGGHQEGYFNGSSYARLLSPISLRGHVGLSFRTCQGGQLFLQSHNGRSVSLEVREDALVLRVNTAQRQFESRLGVRLLDNAWHNLNLVYRLGNLTFTAAGHSQIVSNSTFNSEILSDMELSSDNAVLLVGDGFVGCILQGPSLVFNTSAMHAENVLWGSCPLNNSSCSKVDHCINEPCLRHGVCFSLPDRYDCRCSPRYSGKNCEVDNGSPCIRNGANPCQNNGHCMEDQMGNYKCHCGPSHTGQHCETEISSHICENNPCQNNGSCRVSAVGNRYECTCVPGFTGVDCEININECQSNPCQHGGSCIDGINNYTCICSRTGYVGQNCDININECDLNPCLNQGLCFDNYGSYTCQCMPGFAGQNCEQNLNECSSNPCLNNAQCVDVVGSYECHCQHGFTGRNCETDINECEAAVCPPNSECVDGIGSFQCVCKDGLTGKPPNCSEVNVCTSSPCVNGGTCVVVGDHFNCSCPLGYAGKTCQVNIDECASNPCLNGGTCLDQIGGYICNCIDFEYMGVHCEMEFDACAFKPCKNGGECVTKPKRKEYYCECAPGFDGLECKNNIDDCANVTCPTGRICVDLVNDHECRCPPGYSGDNCTLDVDYCASSPCRNNGTCLNAAGSYVCDCPSGYQGRRCDQDVDECKLSETLCNNGICVNKLGGYDCFCRPGFTGSHCNLDFDECLSRPCQNNATCENLINSFNCVCTPGYTGRECNIDINECDSNPCQNNATCVDGVATFSCICSPGLTGVLCETNIDDCESSPCLNNGLCIDGINSYTCECSDTGFSGMHCENNIDDCLSSPCTNGAQCVDGIKDYTCECFAGYTGKNCELDINECESSPCQYGGTCIQRSNSSVYNDPTLPATFPKKFSFENASGYVCVCVPGITGSNCEVNINECESSPCRWGNCVDKIGRYDCECEEGFMGAHCEIDIDECDLYKPCVNGTCIDRRANYFCDCTPKYGGKNCSVELHGCDVNQCQNNGTCKPYLENETQHKFNCSCTNGYHGDLCEKVTTMSLSGKSYALVNTTRDEGYDIQFRFKTTLPDGLLAIGKGSTYYILELVHGRLNLHSSLLNKWEGVFIGSGLNDSNWQKVFVAINSSHLVLAANEEQTIYPINLNEGSGSSHTSFPTTYLGGTISSLRRLTHGPPSFVGCVEDVVINGNWVLPENLSQPVVLENIAMGCPREPQCSPNPCHNGGHCTDLWSDFSCACERPYLGHTCQYNFTAATFGYENITNGLVTVNVHDQARRAVRSIVDISMFIRTRQSKGVIFQLGSAPTVEHQDQTQIAAQLDGGELFVGIQFNGTPEGYTVGGVRLDDGSNHLIQVVRNVTLVQVKINGSEYFRKTISASGQLDVQVLYLGGVPPNARVNFRPGGTPDHSNFKGIIQDVQISNGSRTMVTEFFPLQVDDLDVPVSFGVVTFANDTVLEGVVSDDTCSSNPCLHNGTCKITWNDFSCECVRGYKGKTCQEMEFCQLQDCPMGSTCRNLNDGYECIANATFNGVNSSLSYSLGSLEWSSSESPIAASYNSIEIMYRSHVGGTLMHIATSDEAEFFSIVVVKDQVTVAWKLGETDEIRARRLWKDHADGDWTTLHIQIKEGLLEAHFQHDEWIEEAQTRGPHQFSEPGFLRDSWYQLLANGRIILGEGPTVSISSTTSTGEAEHVSASDRHSYAIYNHDSSDVSTAPSSLDDNAVDFPTISSKPTGETALKASTNGGFFKGCLGEIRIGGLLLPFFTQDQLNMENMTATEFFYLMRPANETSVTTDQGCILCFEHECHNGGWCSNARESYTCSCPLGFEQDDCAVNTNECIENRCQNNATCVDAIANYTCSCQPGWEGWLCDIDINECESNPCLNNGSCENLLGRFNCLCTSEFEGPQCQYVKMVNCDSDPCKNGSTCRDERNLRTGDNFTCTCAEGFVGPYCDVPFCGESETPCQQGFCDLSQRIPFCNCSPGFTGKLCEENINECQTGPDRMPPCHNRGVCHDGINTFTCDCIGTGYTGPTCEIDVDECATEYPRCGSGTCRNLRGSYRCECRDGFCGDRCSLTDPCLKENPCQFDGICVESCHAEPDYTCQCSEGHSGKNCTESPVYAASNPFDIAIIVAPIIGAVLLLAAGGLIVFIMMARKKRATRGTYSPSQQEYCNPRVEMDNVMKPPPEERLI